MTKFLCIGISLFFLFSCNEKNHYEYWEVDPNVYSPKVPSNRQNYTTFEFTEDTAAVIKSYTIFLNSLADAYSNAFYEKDISLPYIVDEWKFSVVKNGSEDITEIPFVSRDEVFAHLYDSILYPKLLRYTEFKVEALEKKRQEMIRSLAITSYYLSKPNSAGGVSAYFYYKNLSDKTIKYLCWTGIAINAVGDSVDCEARGYYSFNGKDTGPVKKGQTSGGVWDCAWYNYSARKLKITEISIEYMDGTSIVLTGDILESVDKTKRN